MRHLRGLPAAVRLHAVAAWFVADLTLEALLNLLHHRKPTWPVDQDG